MSNEEKKKIIAKHFKAIMETLGLDLSDPSLQRTPQRVASMYVDEIFSGLDPETFPEISHTEEVHEATGMVIVTSSFVSFCEHHFVPMAGTARIAYLPNKKLIGLSKIPRIVRHFARRPQLQERLTAQIASSLSEILGTENIAIKITATHYCVIARGIEDPHSDTTTHLFKGKFKEDPHLRQEFLG